MDNLCGDRAQKEALNSTKTASAHYDVLNVLLTSYLAYRFRNLSGSDKHLGSDAGMSRGPDSRNHSESMASDALANSIARVFCTWRSTSEVLGS